MEYGKNRIRTRLKVGSDILQNIHITDRMYLVNQSLQVCHKCYGFVFWEEHD